MEHICISNSEFSERLKKAQALMEKQGIDLMFAFANESEPQYVRYFSDYWPSFETAGVLFGQKGDAILLIGPESLTFATSRSKLPDIRRIKCMRTSSDPEYPGHTMDTFEEAIETVAGDVKVAAIAGYNFISKIVYDDFAEALAKFGDVNIIQGDKLLMELRKIKSPDEIQCLRNAGEICRKSMWFMLDNIKPGMTEQQVRGLGQQALYELGSEGEAYPYWVTAGEGSNEAISRARRKIVSPQDYVHVSVGVRYEGYVATISRAAFFGEPDPLILSMVKAAYAAQAAVMNEMYDGNDAMNVVRAHYESLRESGHADKIMYGPCHATGLMECEPPWIEEGCDYLLAENMCYCTCIYLGMPNGYGLRVEDSVRIGKTGVEDFTDFPRKIFTY